MLEPALVSAWKPHEINKPVAVAQFIQKKYKVRLHQTFMKENILPTFLKSPITGLFGVLFLQIHLGVYPSGYYPVGFSSCAGSISTCSFTTRRIGTIDSLTLNFTTDLQLSS